MAKVLGIDLGTTNSVHVCHGRWRAGCGGKFRRRAHDAVDGRIYKER